LGSKHRRLSPRSRNTTACKEAKAREKSFEVAVAPAVAFFTTTWSRTCSGASLLGAPHASVTATYAPRAGGRSSPADGSSKSGVREGRGSNEDEITRVGEGCLRQLETLKRMSAVRTGVRSRPLVRHARLFWYPNGTTTHIESPTFRKRRHAEKLAWHDMNRKSNCRDFSSPTRTCPHGRKICGGGKEGSVTTDSKRDT